MSDKLHSRKRTADPPSDSVDEDASNTGGKRKRQKHDTFQKTTPKQGGNAASEVAEKPAARSTQRPLSVGPAIEKLR